jgi:cell division protein FtsZ
MSNKGSALMGIGVATGENRAAEAAKKAVSSPLLETSIDGAQGVLMNITGGTNLSLYEVQEAADIVASASDQEVNMIFGSVINENLKDEIVVTVIATGFSEAEINHTKQGARPVFGAQKSPVQKREGKREEQVQQQHQHQEPVRQQQPSQPQQQEETLDIPTFLRNRNRRR